MYDTSSVAEVYLSLDGGGTTTSLSQAVRIASNNGTIHVRPGTYFTGGTVYLNKSVNIVGEGYPKPVLASKLVVNAEKVSIKNLVIQSSESGSIIRVDGGSLNMDAVSVAYSGIYPETRENHGEYAALYVTGGKTELVNSIIGPGYSQAVSVSGGSVSISNSHLFNKEEYIVFIFGGKLSISSSIIYGDSGIIAQGSGYLYLSGNRFSISYGISIQARDNSYVDVKSNDFDNGMDTNWLCVGHNTTRMELQDNRRTNSQSTFSRLTYCS